MTLLDTKLRFPPRWKEIFDQVRLELPQYAYGSPFYTITEICSKFDVSRITAIRVLNELATRNFIEKIPGKGNVVRLMNKPALLRLIIPTLVRRDYISFDPVNRRLVEGITSTARAQGLNFDTISEAHLQSLFPRPDATFGFLVPKPVARATREFLKTHHLPHVLLDPWVEYKKTCHARVDRVAAGYLATKHLLGLGHRRIAWITGHISDPNFRDRINGYRKAMREAGLGFNWSLIRETQGMDAAVDQAAFEQLMQLRHPPTAILLGDDSRGIHLLETCRAKGIRVPEDVSLLGYPNNPEASLTNPPLSVMDAHYEKVGESAVKILLSQMLENSETPLQQVVVEPQLVLRASTAPPRSRRSGAEKAPVSKTSRKLSNKNKAGANIHSEAGARSFTHTLADSHS